MEKATKTVTHGIYNRVATGRHVGGVKQYRHVKTGEEVRKYTFEVVDTNTLQINGNNYCIEDNSEFAIKVMKTKIKAAGGALGLLKFFMRDTLDAWERKVIEYCKPTN